MMMLYILALLCAVFNVIATGQVSSDAFSPKTISVDLQAGFNTANLTLLLESLEFVAANEPQYFWPSVEQVAGEISMMESSQLDIQDVVQFDIVSKVLKDIQCPLDVNMLKFSLATHYYAAHVETYSQLLHSHWSIRENEDTSDDLLKSPILYSYGTFFSNSLSGLPFDSKISAHNVFDFDHKYPTSHEMDIVVIVYADFSSPEFLNAHKELVKDTESGKYVYILRPLITSRKNSPLYMQGFGVELSIKNMEYKVIDDTTIEAEDEGLTQSSVKDSVVLNIFGEEEDTDPAIEGIRFKELKKQKPQWNNEIEQLKEILKNKNENVNVWDLKDLGIQSSQRILSSSEPLSLLTQISQNFPMYMSALSKTVVNKTLQLEFKNTKITEGLSFLQVNGIFLDIQSLDVFALHSLLIKETRPASQLEKLGYTTTQIRELLGLTFDLPADSDDSSIRLNTVSGDDNIVTWMNNIEIDSQYRTWPRNVQQALLVGGYSGQLKYARRNLHNGVLFINPLSKIDLSYFADAHRFWKGNAPLRLGIAFYIPDEDINNEQLSFNFELFPEEIWRNSINQDNNDEQNSKVSLHTNLVKLFHFLITEIDNNAGWDFLNKLASRHTPITKNIMYGAFKNIATRGTSPYSSSDITSGFIVQILKNKIHIEYANKMKAYTAKTGLDISKGPVLCVNGICTQGDAQLSYRELLMDSIMSEQDRITRAVYFGQYNEYTEYSTIWTTLGTVDRLSPHIEDAMHAKEFMDPNSLMKLKYMHIKDKEDISKLNFVAIVDVMNQGGLELASAIVEYISIHGARYSRGSIILNPENINKLTIEEQFLNNLFSCDISADDMLRISRKVLFLMRYSYGKQELLQESLNKLKELEPILNTCSMEQKPFPISSDILHNLKGISKNILIVNGKIISLPSNIKISDILLDLESLDTFERSIFDMDKIVSIVGEDISENTVITTSQILLQRAINTDIQPRLINSYVSVSPGVVRYESNTSLLQVDAMVDPLSENAQILGVFLQGLVDAFDVDLTVVLNPVQQNSKVPLSRFYRYAFHSSLQFSPSGDQIDSTGAIFGKILSSKVLTMQIFTPESWLVESIHARYDLDNLNLIDLGSHNTMSVKFLLKQLLIAGQFFDKTLNEAPAGLQLVLSEENIPIADTVVMKNLGYFQLQANPGIWKLSLENASATMFGISGDSVIYHEKKINLDSIEKNTVSHMYIPVTRFDEPSIAIYVQRKPGKEYAKLSELRTASSKGSWISSLFSDEKEADDTIHVFSIASGHLYERMLKIMMLSVVEHTDSHVKFWLINNFFSPQFKDFIPKMAEQHGFSVEFVTYKWPKWLNQQTEKQRIIWGYKILFLDVLFPTALPRVIYIDADQVVRGDVKELWDMDLNGAPYAYVPFCDRPDNRNTATDGFRFWEQGYWQNTLGKKKYHISALYVVDLETFRISNAGDTLRNVYDNLSKDPNSLANLDQDLPNYTQSMVPIFSLPQEWLWCQAWCSMESLSKAKTIDLCNNPLTKTPKLEMARSLLPEWEILDAKAAATVIRKDAHSHDEL